MNFGCTVGEWVEHLKQFDSNAYLYSKNTILHTEKTKPMRIEFDHTGKKGTEVNPKFWTPTEKDNTYNAILIDSGDDARGLQARYFANFFPSRSEKVFKETLREFQEPNGKFEKIDDQIALMVGRLGYVSPMAVYLIGDKWITHHELDSCCNKSHHDIYAIRKELFDQVGKTCVFFTTLDYETFKQTLFDPVAHLKQLKNSANGAIDANGASDVNDALSKWKTPKNQLQSKVDLTVRGDCECDGNDNRDPSDSCGEDDLERIVIQKIK